MKMKLQHWNSRYINGEALHSHQICLSKQQCLISACVAVPIRADLYNMKFCINILYICALIDSIQDVLIRENMIKHQFVKQQDILLVTWFPLCCVAPPTVKSPHMFSCLLLNYACNITVYSRGICILWKNFTVTCMSCFGLISLCFGFVFPLLVCPCSLVSFHGY